MAERGIATKMYAQLVGDIIPGWEKRPESEYRDKVLIVTMNGILRQFIHEHWPEECDCYFCKHDLRCIEQIIASATGWNQPS